MDVRVLEFWSFVAAGVLAGVGVVFLAAGVWAVRPRRERRYCAGGVGGRLSLGRVLLGRVCGYDLAGLPLDGEGRAVCPECGRAGKTSRTSVRWRPRRVGMFLCVSAMVVFCAPMVKTRMWQRHVPTTVLIGVKRALGTEWMPTRLRRELDWRLERGGLWGWQEAWVIPGLQRDLRADKQERNAGRAMSYLSRMGRRGLLAIERSLLSEDAQERQLAAADLRRRCWVRTWKGRELVREPSEDLVRVTAEGLRSDRVNWRRGTYDNAYAGFEFLLQFPERAGPYVETGLMSDDVQQRLLSAGLAVQLARAEWRGRCLQILTQHLADNREYQDAKFAAAMLAIMGRDAEGELKRLCASGDKQQKAVAEGLLLRLDPARRKEADAMLARALQAGWWPDEESGWSSVWDVRWTAE